MRKVVGVLLLSLIAGQSWSQSFAKGDNVISLGIGVDPFYFGANAVSNAFGTTAKRVAIGPVLVGYEHGFTDKLGIGRIGGGGLIGTTFYTERYKNSFSESVYRSTRVSFVLRAAYHFDFNIDKMDVYAGVGVAAHQVLHTDEVTTAGSTSTSTSTSFYPGHYVYAGIRYYFTDTFGVYAEAGHGLSAINGGMVFKF